MSIELYTEDRLVYQFYPITTNQITFKVKAPNDAHIMLSSTPYESQPCYEIFFGGWGNTKSVIRKNQQKPDVYEVATPKIMNANEHKGFWIRWDNGTLTAGTQGDTNPILHYQDQLFPIQYFGVCTGWGATGHWIIDNAPAPGYGQVPPQPGSVFPGPPVGGSAPPAANMSYPPMGFNLPAAPNIGFGVGTCAPRWVSCVNGDVPPNAVVGGHDISGEQLYVARANHEGAVVPGKLVPSHKAAYVAWGGRENPKDGYEVLCDCSPRWIPMSGNQVPPGAFISGQTEQGEPLYAGRAHHDGSLTPGKIQPSHGVCYIPFNGQEVSKSEFEILVV